MAIIGSLAAGGMKPTTPTIGTASDAGTGTSASVAFTASSYIGKGTITYTATSSPGSLTGTGSSSPITVSGLTTGTAYTFTVKGTTNYGVVSANSAASNSVTPVNPTSFESIATINLSGVSTGSFTSISSAYKSLQLRFITTNNIASYVQFNSDTTSGNYNTQWLWGDGSSTYSSSATALANTDRIYPGLGPQSGTNPYVGIVDIIDYASTTKNKVVKSIVGQDNSRIFISSGLWLSTSAISTITFFSPGTNFAAGSSVALYGIKG